MTQARSAVAPALISNPRAAGEPVLGIDPGLQRTGFAILSAAGQSRPHLLDAGVIRLAPRDAMPARLVQLRDSLMLLIDQHRPTQLFCEAVYSHYKHPRTAILMAHARGVILATAAAAGLRVHTVQATRVKKALSGSGRASKVQMQRAVAQGLGLREPPQPPDVADAIAIALCGLQLLRSRVAVGAPAECD